MNDQLFHLKAKRQMIQSIDWHDHAPSSKKHIEALKLFKKFLFIIKRNKEKRSKTKVSNTIGKTSLHNNHGQITHPKPDA